jgi:hypothetical protein
MFTKNVFTLKEKLNPLQTTPQRPQKMLGKIELKFLRISQFLRRNAPNQRVNCDAPKDGALRACSYILQSVISSISNHLRSMLVGVSYITPAACHATGDSK